MSKKMCQNQSDRAVLNLLHYDIPSLKINKSGAYVSFQAFDPVSGKMKRKRIKLNHIKGAKARKEYAKGLVNRLVDQLKKGWNPWICGDTENLKCFSDALKRYESFVDKMFADGIYRKETYVGYKSYIKILKEYSSNRNKIAFCYQFDSGYCSEFLDYIFIERNNCAQTRNNYLNFLRVLCGFMVEKGYLKSKPTDAIKPISKRLIKKGRDVIPNSLVSEIGVYAKAHDRDFLLACYLLFYCFLRPVEMTRIKVGDFDVKSCTIKLDESASKNKKTQFVTVPKKVMLYAIELGVLSYPSQFYVFSECLKPGSVQIDPKIFRDHWAKVRKALGFKSQYKFYSLKDTGITEMLESGEQAISVRDQARHSSLAITDIYAVRASVGNKNIINLVGSL